MYIGIDMGHSLSGAGSGAIGIVRETDKNREIGKRLINMLKEKSYKVIDCTCDKASTQNAQLRAITNKANSASLDLFVSIHLNSYSDPEAHGVETLIYARGGKAEKYAEAAQKELVNRIGWRDRGIKVRNNLHVLEATKAPAILVELGFCTNKGDMDKWNPEKICMALFKAITGVEYKSSDKLPPINKIQYRVVVGWYSNRDNAIAQQNKLKEAGFDSFLAAYNNNGTNGFRVVAGTYANRDNAVAQQERLIKKGFDSFLVIV